MLYIVDLDAFIIVAKFSDDEWFKACTKLAQLKKRHPDQRFALRDH